MTTPPAPGAGTAMAPPRELNTVAVLLYVNLGLSVLVTVLSFADFDAILRVTLAHARNSQQTESEIRDALKIGLVSRAVGNVVVGVVYTYLIRRLRQGRRRAWRRGAYLSIVGSLGLVYLLTRPYPAIFKVEQVVQIAVLASVGVLLYRPHVKAFFATQNAPVTLWRDKDTAPGPAADGWYLDPFGRHQVRWFASGVPTEHAADSGVQVVDPPGHR